MKIQRLQTVLKKYEAIIEDKIDIVNYDNFIDKVIDLYIKYYNDEDKNILNEYYMAYAIPAMAIYVVLVDNYHTNKKDIIDIIYQLTYKATEKIYDDLSFVQMAYYLICNKSFLKQLMLRSLSEFDPVDMDDKLVEHEYNYELDKDLIDSTMVDYFDKKGLAELKELLIRLELVIEEFVENHFTKHQRKFTIEDLY